MPLALKDTVILVSPILIRSLPEAANIFSTCLCLHTQGMHLFIVLVVSREVTERCWHFKTKKENPFV